MLSFFNRARALFYGEVKMANTDKKKVELSLKITNADGSVFYENPQVWPSVGERGVITIQRALVCAQNAMLDVAENVAKAKMAEEKAAA
jgi:hypothetical protein